MSVSAEAAGLSLLTFEGSALSFSAWMPSGFTIRTFADSPLAKRDLSEAILFGLLFNAVMGLGASILAKSVLPLFAAAAGSLAGIFIYSHFMNTAHGLGAMKEQQR